MDLLGKARLKVCLNKARLKVCLNRARLKVCLNKALCKECRQVGLLGKARLQACKVTPWEDRRHSTICHHLCFLLHQGDNQVCVFMHACVYV